MTKLRLLAILSFGLAACSPDSDPMNTVLEFQELKNDADLESVLDLFADNPSLHFGPLGTITGIADVRGILEYDLALNTHLQFQECQANGPEVSCRVIESNDWLRTAGIESITYDENRFAFNEDGRIQSVGATLSAESGRLLGTAMAEFHEWAMIHRPTEYGDLFSADGKFVYSQEHAESVVALLRIWRSPSSRHQQEELGPDDE